MFLFFFGYKFYNFCVPRSSDGHRHVSVRTSILGGALSLSLLLVNVAKHI